MKTIGAIIKDARELKHYSIEKIENLTKIKKEFIQSIENEDWEKLPSFSITLGFVKSIGIALDLDPKTVSAFLKRDYPPKRINLSPKPDISSLSKFSWNPKRTFILGVVLVLIVIFIYVGLQYKKFLSPPSLKVDTPQENFIVKENSVIVSGTTDLDAKLVVNNEPVILGQDGEFVVKLNVSKDTKEIIVKAISRSGKETIVSRKIKVE